MGSPSKKATARRVAKAAQVKKMAIDDEDVLDEERAIEDDNLPPDTVIVLRNLVKTFGRGKNQFVAVKGVSQYFWYAVGLWV